jgi:hypothetical protein
MAITLRTVKGSKLTHAELDQNFVDLDNNKINKSTLTGNNKMLVSTSAGELDDITVPASRLVGRLASGGIAALTVAQVKTLLAIVAADISNFNTIVNGLIDAKLQGFEIIAMGKATLVDSVVTVSVPGITAATDSVELQHQSAGSVVYPEIQSEQFVINSLSIEDNGQVFYKVWREIV